MTTPAADTLRVAPQPSQFVPLGGALAGAVQGWIDDVRDEALIDEVGPGHATRLANLLLLQALLTQPVTEREPA